MAMRIELPMSQTRPVEAVADKARDLSRQGLNTVTMKHEQEQEFERRLQRAQEAKAAENQIFVKNDKKGGGGQSGQEQEEEKDMTPEERMATLKRRASAKLLNLSVEPERLNKQEPPKIDIKV